MSTDEMRAVGFHEHGDIDQLELLSVPRPQPGPEEVLVDVKAAALNHQDLIAVRELDHYIPDYPFWGGGGTAGVVAECGERVEDWAPGDRVVVNPALSCDQCEFCLQGEQSMCAVYEVFGEHRKGGFAEYIPVPQENLLTVPDDYDLQTAAAAPMAAGTAWRALADRARVRPDDDVLIVGATGGVGSYAVQFATKVLNARTLYGTTSSEEKAAFLRDLGVDHVINYTEEDFDSRIWELTDERGVDVCYNNVGGDTWVPSLRSLTHGGRLVLSGSTAGPNPVSELRLMFVRQLEIYGSTTHSRTEFETAMGFVFDGTVEPVVQEQLPLEEFERAFRMMDQRELFGKVVLTQD
ncbi:zinc-binding dehydrogenase [Halorarius litoreus]|uniref:zinc-binding dehydrogenase n=1 Tax=Halorarius litoreus TaxID=2962676 RepID=UPI0020CC324E|nr:zinc-binding dehydrogenase [Halorarius litoreus]